MALMSTRHFIQNNKNLKSQKPITINKGWQLTGDNPSYWSLVYILDIFHLSFIIKPNKCLLITSKLLGDNLKEYTDAADIRDSQLYNFILILMSNIDNMVADDQHETKVKAEIVDFMTYFNQRMEFKCLINSPFFQIGYIPFIGLVFKQTRRGVSMVNVVGRPIVTMGPFNVGVFGYIHKKMSNDENRREIQNWFKEAYELSKHSNKNQLTVIAYDWTIGELAKSPEEVTVMLIKALLKDYCISDEVFKSVFQYVNDPIEQKRDLGANKCNEVSHPGGDFDGNTSNPYNFLEMEFNLRDKAYAAVVDSCESVSPNPTIKDTNNIIGLIYKKKIASVRDYILGKLEKLTYVESGEVREVYRFDTNDFLEKTGMMESFQKEIGVLLQKTPNMHMLYSVPSHIVLYAHYEADKYPFAQPFEFSLYGSYNNQTHELTPLKIFRKDIEVVYNFLSTPMNVVKKIDADGQFINEGSLFKKQTPSVSKDVIDANILSFVSCHPFIPANDYISYVRINVHDFIIYMNKKCQTPTDYIKQLLKKENKHRRECKFFINKSTKVDMYQLCVGNDDTICVDYTPNTQEIVNYLRDNFLSTQ